MADKLKYRGVGTGNRNLIVYVDVEVNGVSRAHSIKVPFRDLTDKEVQYEVNLAVAHRLRLEWETDPPPWRIDDELPGIG